MPEKRDWQHKYALQKKSGETDDQLERQRARRALDKKGVARKGKHIDHVTPIRAGGTSSPGNLKLRDPGANMADNASKGRKAVKK